MLKQRQNNSAFFLGRITQFERSAEKRRTPMKKIINDPTAVVN